MRRLTTIHRSLWIHLGSALECFSPAWWLANLAQTRAISFESRKPPTRVQFLTTQLSVKDTHDNSTHLQIFSITFTNLDCSRSVNGRPACHVCYTVQTRAGKVTSFLTPPQIACVVMFTFYTAILAAEFLSTEYHITIIQNWATLLPHINVCFFSWGQIYIWLNFAWRYLLSKVTIVNTCNK